MHRTGNENVGMKILTVEERWLKMLEFAEMA